MEIKVIAYEEIIEEYNISEISSFMKFFHHAFSLVPNERKSTARINLEPDESLLFPGIVFRVTYIREENEKEKEEREAMAYAKKAMLKTEDIAQLNRLRAKYPDE